jgi:hypothetical protein
MLPPETARNFRISPAGVNSTWLDDASIAMWMAARDDPFIHSNAALHATSVYSYEKLRILGSLGFIVGWWWVREALVWTIMHRPDYAKVTVDDQDTVMKWKWAMERIQAQEHEKEMKAEYERQAKKADQERQASMAEEAVATEFGMTNVIPSIEPEAYVTPQQDMSHAGNVTWADSVLGPPFEAKKDTNELSDDGWMENILNPSYEGQPWMP